MREHQRLQLAVVGAAPEFSFQESETDFDFALRRLQIAVARAADDSARLALDHGEGALGIERPLEELLEDRLGVAVALGVLRPDQGIAGGVQERVPIVGGEWAHIDQLAAQRGLKVELHFKSIPPRTQRTPRDWPLRPRSG